MSEKALYDVQLRFSVDATHAPPRKALHGALETLRAVVVEASSIEEAEAQVDQIRVALEAQADDRAVVDRLSWPSRPRQTGGRRRWR